MIRRRAVGVAGWLLMLALALWALRVAGRALPAPPVAHPGRWGEWLEGRDPVVAAFALLRAATLAAWWYLAAATVAGLGLRAIRARRLTGWADRLTIPPLRRLLAPALTVGLATAGPGLLAPSLGWAAAEPPVPAAASALPPGRPADLPADQPRPTVTMHRVAASDPAPATPGSAMSSTTLESPAAEAPGSPMPAPEPRRWRVRPGDCFWSIAQSVLARAWGHPPTDAELVPYWRDVIEANRAALADPHNPDLIFPGQDFSVPPPPAAPSGASAGISPGGTHSG